MTHVMVGSKTHKTTKLLTMCVAISQLFLGRMLSHNWLCPHQSVHLSVFECPSQSTRTNIQKMGYIPIAGKTGQA